MFKVPKFKYNVKTLLIWLWRAWKGNQLQAVLNASIGLLSVGVSLAQVWAVKRAIDVASHAVEGDIYWAVGLMGCLILADNGKQVNESFPINHETVYQRFLNASPDVKSAEYEVEKARYDYKIAKGRLLPSLSLSGGISTNFYRNLSQGGQYEGFASQFRNNRGEYLALTLSIPIYNNVAWHQVKKARNDWQLAQVNLEETKRKLHDHIAQAVMDAEGYAKELEQMDKKVASDSLAYYMSSRKFEEGMLSTFDLHTAAQTLLESRIKQLQMQMLLVIKQRLVGYYQGKNLIK